MKKLFLAMALALCSLGAYAGSTIKVFFAYTPTAASSAALIAGSTALFSEALIDSLNNAIANTGTGLTSTVNFAIAGSPYTTSKEYSVQIGGAGTMSDAQYNDFPLLGARDASGGDLTFIVSTVPGASSVEGSVTVGVASSIGPNCSTSVCVPDESFASGLTNYVYGGTTFQHEIGHLMGFSHEASLVGGTTLLHGYNSNVSNGAQVSCFHTIMAHGNSLGYCPTAGNDTDVPGNFFSNTNNVLLNDGAYFLEGNGSAPAYANIGGSIATNAPLMATYHNTRLQVASVAGHIDFILWNIFGLFN